MVYGAKTVFDRSGSDTLSERAYYMLLGLLTLWSLGATGFTAFQAHAMHFHPTKLIAIGLCLIPFAGIFLTKVENVVLSFLGLNLICLPFGFLLSGLSEKYAPGVIGNACLGTGCVTVTMICLGTIYPKVFAQLGGALFAVLIGLVVLRIAQIFIPELGAFHILDWIGAGLFSLYIGYDWYRAYSVPKTISNAMDVAVSLYLDVLNLFMNILSLFGESND